MWKSWVNINILSCVTIYDAKHEGPARHCRPGTHVHFRDVSHIRGISGFFWFVLPLLPLRAQFLSELPEILHEVS